MPERMHPPGSPQHGVAIIIAAHPSSSSRMMPPGMKAPADEPMPDEAATPESKDGKASPEEAQVIREDQRCVNCKNYDGTSGMCAKVAGSFDAGDACVKYFEAMSEDEDESDDDDTGGPPDADADDQPVLTA